jgi:hypothetical protein
MKTYSLILSKHSSVPAMTVPFRWILKYFVEPFLKNCNYYAIKDRYGELLYEREILPA